MFFDKNGYLKLGISEDVVRKLVCKYAEQQESQTQSMILSGYFTKFYNSELSYLGIAKKLIPVEPLLSGALPIYEKSDDICNHCGNDRKICCADAECFICTSDNYCENAQICPFCSVKTELSTTQQVDEEDESLKKLLDSVDLNGSGATSSDIGSIAPTKKEYHANGMVCIRCNVLNKYVTEANQPNGSYICYGCRSGF